MRSKVKTELVPIDEAATLWRRHKRTLQRWANACILLYDIIGTAKSERSQWYVETPMGRYNRIHNINA